MSAVVRPAGVGVGVRAVTHHLELEESVNPQGSPAVPVLIPGASTTKPEGMRSRTVGSLATVLPSPLPVRVPDSGNSLDSPTPTPNSL